MIIDPFFPHIFPPCYIPKALTIYKVPIQRCSNFVYMKANDDLEQSYSTVIVARDSFLHIWNDSPRHDDLPFVAGIPYAKTPQIWTQDRKLCSGGIATAFSYGISNPVNIPIVNCISDKKLYYTDGITRTLFLLVNGAEAFPIMCPNEYFDELKYLASPA